MAAFCSASPAISTAAAAAALVLPARRSSSLFRLRLPAAARSYSAAAQRAAAAPEAPSWRARRRFAASAASTTEEGADADTMIPPDNRIPATIITGFLGSGKVRALIPEGPSFPPFNQVRRFVRRIQETEIEEALKRMKSGKAMGPDGIPIETTLLNHILTAHHGKRIAVIENEFGEVDIDGSLVAAQAAGAEDIMMLNNGASAALFVLSDTFTFIMFYSSGLANPAPIIQTFYAEDVVFNDVKLDGVVTLVDAKHARLHLDEVKPKGIVNEAVQQIAYADRIIVNKIDLVNETEVSSLVERIKGINSMANLKRAEYGKVDLDYVLGIGGFDLERIESAVSEESHEDHADREHEHDHHHHEHHHDHHHHDHDHGHDHHAHDHTHDPGVSSVSIVCEGEMDLEKADMFLGNLLLEHSEDIYRMKGLLSVSGMPQRFVFQGVHDIFQGSPERMWEPNEPRINKIVFIGKNLNREELEKGFKDCLLKK
ncbi:hypothetical protein PR202_gb10048 [Eleusine coracana subsp. coracana]|uniref:CobW C-terminal domain-containing protein n=1 Tax=Eleusine coracana subsp. coracana TaxID=191504 RepID=A0AAV5EGJ0_ELECO|nr:hypothetical protein PR202_gb10048 [Eleusine coracana subsp. coracana]